MVNPLLRTKLYAPPLRAQWVSRPRLVQRLSAAQRPHTLHKVTLVSAPAGFGKTTLISEWVAGCGSPVAWLSLDAGDNRPAQFWAYLVSALRTIPQLRQAGVGAAAQAALASPQFPSPDGGSIEDLIAGLINELSTVEPDPPFVAVLDDLHAISDRQIHDQLLFLVNHLPPSIRLILSSRSDPPWPLARMRVRGELVEVRAPDLRFTLQETSAFLNTAMGLDLSASDVAVLGERTEGWIAGLQMAAISMQARTRGHGDQDLSGFVHAFAGTNRFILDYLVEEVLDQQPPEIQDLLLQTSILDHLTAPLCNAVCEIEDSQSMLIELEQGNLFVVPLDDERRWYRYHHLFAELLQGQLRRTRAHAIPDLHRRASAWYERRGQIVDAVNHALLAEDVERVARLVAGNALAIMGHGELAALARWLDTIPGESVRAQPWLGVARAWVWAYVGQLDEARDQLDALEHAAPVDPAEPAHIAGHVTAIRAYVAGLGGEIPHAAELARQALAMLPETDRMARGFVTSLLGSTLRWCGELETAETRSAEAIAISETIGSNRIAADAFCDMAALQIARGQLRRAAETCRNALRLAQEHERRGGRPLPVTGFAHARLSAVLCEWDQLQEALTHGREAVELCEEWGWADGMVFGYEYLTRTLQASGDLPEAARTAEKARRIAAQVSPWLASHVATFQVSIWLAQGQLDEAVRWANEAGLRVNDEIDYLNAEWGIALARILVARARRCEDPTQGKRYAGQAVDLFERLLRVVGDAGATGHVIEMLVDLAIAYRAHGSQAQALQALRRALELARPERYARTFAGGETQALLREIAAREPGVVGSYARELLAAFEPAAPSPAPPALLWEERVEPLSERELEVLGLLRTYMTGTEIAEQLTISVHTVHSHIKNVYGKLGVHSRAEAVQRAEELGLI